MAGSTIRSSTAMGVALPSQAGSAEVLQGLQGENQPASGPIPLVAAKALRTGAGLPIHASSIDFSMPAQQATSVVVSQAFQPSTPGQASLHGLGESNKALLCQAIQNNSGLFQMVSPRAQANFLKRFGGGQFQHIQEKPSREVSLLEQILALEPSDTNPLILSPKWKIVGLVGREINNSEADGHSTTVAYNVRIENEQGQSLSMRLTQAAPPYDGRALSSEALQEMLQLQAAHMDIQRSLHSINRSKGVNLGGVQPPALSSFYGIGRAASLAVAFAFKEQLNDAIKAGVDVRSQVNVKEWVNQLIEQGRQQRSTKFIHTPEQHKNLYEACLTHYTHALRAMESQALPQVTVRSAVPTSVAPPVAPTVLTPAPVVAPPVESAPVESAPVESAPPEQEPQVQVGATSSAPTTAAPAPVEVVMNTTTPQAFTFPPLAPAAASDLTEANLRQMAEVAEAADRAQGAPTTAAARAASWASSSGSVSSFSLILQDEPKEDSPASPVLVERFSREDGYGSDLGSVADSDEFIQIHPQPQGR